MRTPYPRNRERTEGLELWSWALYLIGAGFIMLGAWWLVYNSPEAVLSGYDYLTRFGIVLLGAALKIYAQSTLMRLQGRQWSDCSLYVAVFFWLPWFLRAKGPAAEPRGYDELPRP